MSWHFATTSNLIDTGPCRDSNQFTFLGRETYSRSFWLLLWYLKYLSRSIFSVSTFNSHAGGWSLWRQLAVKWTLCETVSLYRLYFLSIWFSISFLTFYWNQNLQKTIFCLEKNLFSKATVLFLANMANQNSMVVIKTTRQR